MTRADGRRDLSAFGIVDDAKRDEREQQCKMEKMKMSVRASRLFGVTNIVRFQGYPSALHFVSRMSISCDSWRVKDSSWTLGDKHRTHVNDVRVGG